MNIHFKTAIVASSLMGLTAIPSALGFDIVIRQGSFQAGQGGEFVAVTSPSFNNYYSPLALQNVGGDIGFSTFCLEKSESISFGVPYSGVLNDRAMSGGVDITENPNLPGDPISLATAWLYTQFAKGTLDSYDYGTAPYSNTEKAARKADAAVLQNAIWMLEDEAALDLGNYYIDLAINKFGDIDSAKASNNGFYHVAVMNITENGVRRQDALVCVPDAGATLGLLGAGLLGIYGIRRRQTA